MKNLNHKSALLAAVIACAFVFGVATGAVAQTCEYPLFITQGSVEANVMFIFDNSGSMNEVIWHDDYDPNASYSGNFNQGDTYFVGSDGNYSFNGRTAYLVDSDQGQDGRYMGNYLNWIYWHATSTQRAAIPRVTRVQVAKAAVNSIIDENPNIRFGIMKFNYDDGGSVVSPVGTDHATIKTQVSNIEADTFTPIAETMLSARTEFRRTDAGAPIQYRCQKTFLVIVSDGYPTMDRKSALSTTFGDQDGDGNEPGNCASIGAPYDASYDCSDYMDDAAYYLAHTDLRGDLDGDQFVFTYAVGFNIDAPLFQETADNGQGLYLSANNPGELKTSLDSVLRDIVNRISSGSAVAVVSTEGESEDLLFRGKFEPSRWRGFLEAFTLPYDPGDLAFWEAGEILSTRSPSGRTIFTSVAGSQVDFDDSYASFLQADLGAATTTEAQNIINWTRGVNVAGYRDRGGWLLGDIIDSSPLVVGAPSSFHLYNDYLAFRTSHLNRTRVLYIGANDGMLHCFRESDGEELWAYVPNTVLPRLNDLADADYCHEYFVNLTPTVVDAYISNTWKTVLIGGLKHGGASYFAIDVTDPESPQFMWETTLPNINESWSHPEVVRVKSLDKHVVFLGSGPDYVNGEAYAMAMDIEDGSQIWSEQLSTQAGLNIATSATTVDIDYDGYDDLVYLSDLAGNLWRIDIRGNTWDRTLLFSTNQPIQAQPIVTVDYNDDVYIYFGTGRYIDPADISDSSQQTFYCVIDDHSGASVTRSDMVDQTTSITPLSADDRGWYIDLNLASGERIVEPDALVAGIVYFTSFAPTDEPCSAGGYSWLYKVKFRNGAGDDGDDNADNDTTDNRVEEIGEGVTTKPVVDIVNEKVIVQGSDTRIHVKDTNGVIRQLIVRSWRQLYQ